jgi:hypothetical protein
LHSQARFANGRDLARKDMFKASPTGIIASKSVTSWRGCRASDS